MANFRRGTKGKARRHRSIMYSGVWGGNGSLRFKSREAKDREAAAKAIREAKGR